LTLYCGSVGYLRNCEVGAERIDLDGDVTGVVTEAEAEHARVKLAADTKKAATAATPQPPAERLSLADLKRAAQMRKEAAQ
jgi:sRNA-binding protein